MKRKYFNLELDVLDRQGVFRAVRETIRVSSQININFLNAHCFNVAQKNAEYASALKQSSLLLNDGIGVDIGAKVLGFRFPENLNGTDLIPELVGVFAEDGVPVFFLGARDEVISKAVETLTTRFPSLRVAGYSSGYFKDEKQLNARISESGACAVIVGMGVPLQELWVQRNKANLPGIRVFVAGGAIFDFLSGTVKRAPLWVQKLKLEWLFRLLQEPKRLFSRYVIGNFVFLLSILLYKIRQ